MNLDFMQLKRMVIAGFPMSAMLRAEFKKD